MVINYQPIPPISVPTMVPFTHKDGAYYVEILKALVKYLDTMVDKLNEVNSDWGETINAAIETINASVQAELEKVESVLAAQTIKFDAQITLIDEKLSAQTVDIDLKLAELMTSVNAAIETVINASIELNDEIALAIVNDTLSDTRNKLDELYLITDPVTKNMVASEAARGIIGLATLGEVVARSNAGAAVTPSTMFNARTILEQDSNRLVKHGYVDVMFTRLLAGVKDVAQDTRVVCLGSSTMGGGMSGGAVFPGGMDFASRLAFAAGSKSIDRLEDVNTSTAPAGMIWYNGAVGGTTAANYLTTATATRLGHVKPHYILHMVGSNDWIFKKTAAAYKNDMRAALNAADNVSADSIHVLLHQQPRIDGTGVSTWAEYGAALAELAAEQPTKRVFIDLNKPLDKLDIGNLSNRWGLVTSDKIHVGVAGHRLLAETAAMYMGIPKASDIGGEYVELTFPASATHTKNTVLAETTIAAAPYPRLVQLTGVVYAAQTGASAESDVNVVVTEVGGTAKIAAHRIPSFTTKRGNGSIGLSVGVRHIIPPGKTVNVGVELAIPAGADTYVSGSPAYTQASITTQPF